VRRFAEEGAQVVFTDVAAAATAQQVASDTGATALAADAAHIEDMQSLIPHVVERHGRLDLLVNNAGVSVEGPMVESTREDDDRVMTINVRATYLLLREAATVLPQGP
jgi:NAD(P)-dependent dehydrogenase (short-subunit alcohol dehydrogenase family)